MEHPLKAYWRLYGGSHELLNSPYLFWSVILTLICWPFWARNSNPEWASISIDIIPGIMGFSIAGMTVLLAFSDTRPLRVLTQHGRQDSYYVKTVGNFYHFLFVQVIALVLALVARAYTSLPAPLPAYALYFFGVWALIYAIFVTIGTAGQLLNTAIIINQAAWVGEQEGSASSQPTCGKCALTEIPLRRSSPKRQLLHFHILRKKKSS